MQNCFLGVIFTNHALQRLRERRITQSDAWYTLKHPDQNQPGKTAGSFKFSKSYGPQKIEVVAKLNEKREWVVLSCWSRELGTNQPLFPIKKNFLEKIINHFFDKIEEKWRRKDE